MSKTEILIALFSFTLGIIATSFVFLRFIWKRADYDEFDEEIDSEIIKVIDPKELQDILSGDGVIDLSKLIRQSKKIEEFDTSISDISTFKEQITALLHNSVNKDNQDYEKGAYLRDLHKDIDHWYESRKKWFIDHIGKRVKPSEAECPCAGCKKTVKDGFIIDNEKMALYLFSRENKSLLHQGNLRFLDFE